MMQRNADENLRAGRGSFADNLGVAVFEACKEGGSGYTCQCVLLTQALHPEQLCTQVRASHPFNGIVFLSQFLFNP